MSPAVAKNGTPRDDAPLEPGLYLVPTPIGNLEDITLRALRVLSSCDLVAAEDTRRVRKLLNHFDIAVKTLSYREHNRVRATPQIIDAIRNGSAVALVSDAGTPCVSDPGAELVAACASAGLKVIPLPGPCAAVAAVAASGFPADNFAFLGFPPARKAARLKMLESVRGRPETLVFYEAPHRVAASLADMLEALGDRRAVAFRELTKLHEERIGDSISAILDELQSRGEVRGEFALVVAGAGEEKESIQLDDRELERRYRILLAEGTDPRAALKALAEASGRPKRELYDLLRRDKG